MEKTQKSIKMVSIALLIQTVIWLIFTIISMSGVKSDWKNADFVRWASHPDFFFTINYINATLLTLVAIILFTLMFNYFYQNHKNPVMLSFVFVPIYGLLNIVCYSLQINIVPAVSLNALNNPDMLFIASQLIQANNQSLIGFLNGLAYAILGIPSIIFGTLIFREKKKLAGIFLISSGFMSIIGIIGYILANQILSTGTMIGGIAFLMFLIFSSIEF